MDNKTLSIEIEALKKENRQLRSDNSKQIGSPENSDFQDSQVRFRTVFESSTLGNKIISPDFKILQTNPAMVELLGYNTKEEIIGTKIIDYSPPECKRDWEVLHENIWKRCKPSFSMETCLQRKDGSRFWCHVTSILFRDTEGILGYTIIEENTYDHNLKIEKEEFISTASHELKTPITSLKARLQIMNRLFKTETSITDKLVQLSREAELYTSKITHLVEDLLNLTKFEHGELALNKSRFKLRDAVSGCCNHVQLNDKHHVKYIGDQSLTVFADMLKIDHVLINLIDNAMKYAPDSDEIIINAEQLNERIKISVTDYGKGIAQEKIPQLFDRYYRVDRDANKSSGLGLGLYISAEIINRHGGEIGVESEPGKGSTFWFTIPNE